LHRATSCYTPSPGTARRRRWDDERVFHLPQAATVFPENDLELHAEFHDLWEWLKSLTENSANFGLTHNDAHRGNFFHDGDRITLFDTSSAFYCWFAYDLAQPLYYSGPVFFGDRAATPGMLAELKADLVAGYGEEFPISDDWVKRIDGFVRLRRLQMHCFMYWQFGGPIEDAWFVRNREAMKNKEPLL
jgi:Ser/Thr protein kinase RdoA (MazF antagonist)